jgi:hypothetical protein
MSNLISIGITLLSQVFVGLILGLCWNVGMTQLGLNSISYIGAIVVWFAMSTIVFIFSFIHASVLKSVMLGSLYTTTTNHLPPKNPEQ